MCWQLVVKQPNKDRFETIILMHIILNTLVMCMPYAGMSPGYTTMLEVFDAYFMVIFTLEVFLKVGGMGWFLYWPVFCDCVHYVVCGRCR